MKSLQNAVKITPLVLGMALASSTISNINAIQYNATVAPVSLAIPSGGFTSPVAVDVTMTVTVIGNWNNKMYLHDYAFSIWDDDPLSDDLLIKTSGLLTPMIKFETTTVTTDLQIELPVDALNNAVDWPEGDFLELILTDFTPSIFVDNNDDGDVDEGEEVPVPDSGLGSLPVYVFFTLLLLAKVRCSPANGSKMAVS